MSVAVGWTLEEAKVFVGRQVEALLEMEQASIGSRPWVPAIKAGTIGTVMGAEVLSKEFTDDADLRVSWGDDPRYMTWWLDRSDFEGDNPLVKWVEP